MEHLSVEASRERFHNEILRMSRRHWLLCGVGAILVEMMSLRHSIAAEKLSKAAVFYQDHSLPRKSCSFCAHFLPAHEPGKAGQCQIVAGDIAPQGHCAVWTERNPGDRCA